MTRASDRRPTSSGREAHRTWIQQARAQSDEAERNAANAQWPAVVSRDILRTDSFPGYELERELHRGAQGAVYLAVQKSTGRRVALKLWHHPAFGEPLERARFERETRVLAALQHPNIVSIHDGGSHAGRVFLVMDYIAGQPLDVYIASQPRSVRQRLELFVPICEAVNAAHLRGIIHRDLKPANVRVDETGRPFVLDFGLAKVLEAQSEIANRESEMTVAGQFLGSLPWAAPEQAEGSPSRIDTRTDVYALGVLLYQMLTGGFPYPVVGTMQAVLDNIVRVEPIRPRTLSHDIDDEVETIVLKCLSKDRERRYQTAGELARDLIRYLAGEPIEAKRDSAWYVLRKAARRYRVPAAVVALVLVLLAGSSVVGWTLSVRAERAAADARRAELSADTARQEALRNLHESLIAQARASRRSGWMGQRFDALAALEKAADITLDRPPPASRSGESGVNPLLQVRNEAIAALALTDLRGTRHIERNAVGYFDPEWARCAAAHRDGAITIVRVEDDAELARVPPPAPGVRDLYGVALRGPYLARCFDPPEGQRRLEVWKVGPEEPRLALELEDVPFRAGFDFSPDGKHLAAGRLDQAIHIYDLGTMQEVQRIALDRDPSYLAFDPTGRRLLLYHANFLAAELLDLDTGAREPVFESRNIAWSVAWHPQGQLVAGASVRDVELWDTDRHQRIALLAGHEDQVVRVAFSHDGALLLSYSWDGVTVLWDVRSRRPLLRAAMAAHTFSPDGRRLASHSAADNGEPVIKLLELECGGPWQRLTAGDPGSAGTLAAGSGAFEPGSGLLVTADTDDGGTSVLRVYDPSSGRELARRPSEQPTWLAMERDGRFLVTAEHNSLLRWPLHVEKALTERDSGPRPARLTIGLPAPLTLRGAAVFDHDRLRSGLRADAIAMSADGRVAVFGSLADGTFSIADLQAGAIRTFASGGRASSVRVSPDGRWVAIGGFWQPRGGEVWETASAQRVAELGLVGVSYAEFSPDGSWLVTSDTEGLVVWEIASWRAVRRSAQRAALRAISPDGRLLATTLDRGHIRLIDFATLSEVATLEPPESHYPSNCAFSSDGALLAQFTNRHGVVHLWDLRRLRAELAGMGLDWDQPPYSPAPQAGSIEWQITLHAGDSGEPGRSD